MNELAKNFRETWKDAIGYEGLYQVSNLGRIKSLYNYKRNGTNILKPRTKKGYCTIGLRKNGIRKWHQLHRLIALAFIPNPYNYKCVNHKDENKQNNNIENLEWCTARYNNIYGTRIKKIKQKLNKKVLQFDLNNNFIKEYESILEASKENNIKSSGNIIACIKGKYNQAGGYKWKYKEVV